MPGLLIPLFAVLVAAAQLGRPRPTGPVACREAIVLGMLASGVWAVAGAEVLSLFGSLRPGPVLAWWLAACGIAVLFLFRGSPAFRVEFRRPPAQRDRGAVVLILGTGLLLGITFWLAACYPTTTTDCWIYHLPRQHAWAAAGTVDHFPAHHLFQLQMPPMAEYLGVQWLVLSGGDGWGNMHQWFAMLGMVLASSLIARELGAGGRGQALAGLLTVLNPAALNQSVNGKNDLLVGLWVLTMAWLAARMWRRRSCRLSDALLIGCALGLALLTKGTAYLIAAPLCIVIAIVMLRLARVRGLGLGAVVGIAAIALNVGFWQRNQQSFGWPLGRRQSIDSTRTEAVTAASFASGVVKSIAMHAATPSPAANLWVLRGVEAMHRGMGLEVNDDRTTMLKAFPFELRWRLAEDGNSSSPLHLALAILLPLVALARPPGRSPELWVALALPYATFILYAGLMRWQPWQHRLEIPILAMLAPVAGVLLPRSPSRALNAALVIGGAALACAGLAMNRARPLVGENSVLRGPREAALFVNAPHLRIPLETVADEIARRRPATVGHILQMSPFEYPLLRTVRRIAGGHVRIIPLNPNFGPRDGLPVPELVIGVDLDGAGPIFQLTSGRCFVPVAWAPPLTLYADADRAAESASAEGLPPFFGWERSTGLAPPEGPYPQFDLPIVRWARESRTVLTVRSAGGTGELLMECRRNDRNDQAMTVRLNGAEVYSFRFGGAWRFFQHRVPLSWRPGLNKLTIEYANTNDPGPPRSVLYSRLQVIAPRAPGESPPPAPAPAPSPPMPAAR